MRLDRDCVRFDCGRVGLISGGGGLGVGAWWKGKGGLMIA
ncbi:unnamed protein product [Ectocarpus sp. 6 AP-2014]